MSAIARRGVDVDARQLALFDAAPGRVVAQPSRPAAEAPGPAPTEPVTTALYRHPRGQREVLLDGHAVVDELRRARRKSIGFSVGPDGLSVNAPAWLGAAAIETALKAKTRWILRKLADQRERSQRAQSARVDWRDGAEIAFLGRPIVVVLDPRAGLTGRSALLEVEAAADPATPAAIPPTRARLRIGLPHHATGAQIRDVVQSWLQRQARRIFEERLRHFAPQLGVRCTRLALSSAQTRWGSASADGSIRLNWRLVHFTLPTIDYVVAHELAHLREMNHSPRFWDVVRSVLPDYERARGALKTDLLPRLD